MVFIKVSLGRELRKFSVEKESSIDALKTTIKSLFPILSQVPDIANLVLLYRDSDGDLITMSSDQELQAALSHLGDSDTLRVSVRVIETPQEGEQEEEMESRGGEEGGFGDLFHLLFDHHPFSHHPFSHHPHHHGGLFDFGVPNWFGRQHALRLHEEKIRQQRLYEEKMRQARMEQIKAMREKAAKEQEDLRKKIKEERKKSTDLQTVEGRPLLPQFPDGWQVNPFGSWDPIVEEGPNFTRKSWGPYGYVAYYNSEGKKEEKEEKKEGETEGEAAATEMEDTPTD